MSVIEHEIRTTPEPLVEPDPVLLRAVEILRERGWCQDYVGVADEAYGPKVCALGAIAVAVHGVKRWVYDDVPQVVALARSLGYDHVERPHAYTAVYEWNDAEGRTADEVAEALERAAYGL